MLVETSFNPLVADTEPLAVVHAGELAPPSVEHQTEVDFPYSNLYVVLCPCGVTHPDSEAVDAPLDDQKPVWLYGTPAVNVSAQLVAIPDPFLSSIV
jgi:hypothetical protein